MNNNNLKIRIKKGFISIASLLLIYSLFVISDMNTSIQMKAVDTNRSLTHMTLIASAVFLLLISLINLKYLKIKDYFLLILTCLSAWIFFSDRINNVPFSQSYIREAMSILWILSYMFMKSYGNKYPRNIEYLKKFFIIIYYIFIIWTIYYSIKIFINSDSYQVMNSIYNILICLPFFNLVYTKNKDNMFLWISIIMVFFSFKRTAIFALIAMLMVLFFHNSKITLKKLIYFVITVTIMVASIYLINRYTGGFLFSRFSGDNFYTGSGRTYQYSFAIEDIKTRDVFSLVFGKGSAYSLESIGFGIHNEWLEMLSSYGVVGLFLYICMYLMLIQRCFKLPSVNKKTSMILMTVYCLILSVFSVLYFGYIGIQAFFYFGIINSNIMIEKE